jgi:hypothetical protein
VPAGSSPDLPAEYLEFRYFGFYAALRRFRTTTVTGWGVSAVGMIAFLLSWEAPAGPGGFSIFSAAALVAAGIVVVQSAVMSLHSYVSVPFPPVPHEWPEHARRPLAELEPLFAEVRDGGWDDAFRALAGVRAIGAREGLPGPDRRATLPTMH